MEAVKQCSYAIEHIPTELLFWKEVCMQAVKQDGFVIRYIPKEFLTEEICIEAMKQNYFVIRCIPREFFSKEVCTEATRQNRDAIRNISPALQLQVIKQLAVTKKLENGTECLIMGDAIGIGDYYKSCTVKRDHVISFESWLKLDSEQQHICCYCKGKLLEEIFCNI